MSLLELRNYLISKKFLGVKPVINESIAGDIKKFIDHSIKNKIFSVALLFGCNGSGRRQFIESYTENLVNIFIFVQARYLNQGYLLERKIIESLAEDDHFLADLENPEEIRNVKDRIYK